MKIAQVLILLPLVSCAGAQEFLHDKEPGSDQEHHQNQDHHQVPEPISISLLAGGAAAAVAGVMRRRKK